MLLLLYPRKRETSGETEGRRNRRDSDSLVRLLDRLLEMLDLHSQSAEEDLLPSQDKTISHVVGEAKRAARRDETRRRIRRERKESELNSREEIPRVL